MTRTPARRQRQPGVQQAGERRAAPGHLVDRRLQHVGEHLVDQAGRRPRQRRVGAHAAGVRARVAVADPLEVLRRHQRHAPSCRRRARTATPPGRRGTPRRRPARRWPRAPAPRPRSVVTTTPLPAASPSSFTTYGGPSSSSAAAASSGVLHTRACAVGTPAAAITSLANALDPSSCGGRGGRPEAVDAALPDGVGDAGDQRPLRADHDQVDGQPEGQLGHGRRVGDVQRPVLDLGGDAGVARRGDHRGRRPGRRAAPGPARARGRRRRRRGPSRASRTPTSGGRAAAGGVAGRTARGRGTGRPARAGGRRSRARRRPRRRPQRRRVGEVSLVSLTGSPSCGS